MKSRKPHPTFNHVAMSVPADLLDARGRAALLAFYGEVFGWSEMPTLTEDRSRLVLRAYDHEQFVFLISSPQPMRCPPMDHFGMSVATPAELDALLDRAEKYRERDPEVQIDPRHTAEYGFLKLHSFYVRYRLPMRVEVQCFEWRPEVDTSRAPDGSAPS